MKLRVTRLVSLIVIGAALAIPAVALAADPSPAPSPAMVDWADHFDQMRWMHGDIDQMPWMHGDIETAIGACSELHDSPADMPGQTGSMGWQMDGGMMR